MRTQQYIQLNTGAKEIRQLNLGPQQQTRHQAPVLSSIDDKYLSRNRHRV